MAEEPTTVPIDCPTCDTTARVPLAELADTLARHDEVRHGGERAARVDPDVADELADLVAAELGLVE